jgi:PAS domain-containing protein
MLLNIIMIMPALHRQAEEEASKAKDFLTNAIENSLDPIIISDNKGCIVRANKYFLKMIGGRGQEVIGTHMAEFSPMEEGIYESTMGGSVQIGKEFFDAVRAIAAKLVEGDSITNCENYLMCNDRKVVPVVLIAGWDIRQDEAEMKDSYVDLLIHNPLKWIKS